MPGVDYGSSQFKGFALIFDSNGLVPGLVDLPLFWEEWFWVRAHYVYASGHNIIRKIQYTELLGVWDYEGKLESTNWTKDIQKALNDTV